MRILIIRHGDPDYSIDSLTETGFQEAEALSSRVAREFNTYHMTASGSETARGNVLTDEAGNRAFFYVSILGRARATAAPSLSKLGCTAEPMSWLQEFPLPAVKPRFASNEVKPYAWDWYPADWTVREAFYDRKKWLYEPEMAEAGAKEQYAHVCDSLDELLEGHGYRRHGNFYDAVTPNHDTLVFFCHFGLECVLLSHLLGISPMPLWHGTCAAPTGVTTIYTEEREQGIANFRMAVFGDTSHLTEAGLAPSFSARFCECYTDETRH